MITILCLAGSPVDEFQGKVSRLYAQGCLTALAGSPRYRFVIAYVMPGGGWRFPADLSAASLAAAPTHTLPEALQWLAEQPIDLALPLMYCLPGMTAYRSLLDLLAIPYLGNRTETMTLTADKAKTRAVVAAAGVAIPHGELLRAGDVPRLLPPVVVKPTQTDNSIGISLVKTAADYEGAIAAALAHSSEVLIETYIPLGREIRCGLIDQNGTLTAIPLKEYRLDPDHKPIRALEDKLRDTDSGELELVPKDGIQSEFVEPDDPVIPAIVQSAKQAHRALGCRHYSLFDFRVDPDGKPWFIEAGLYCSFSKNAVIVSMVEQANLSLETFFDQMVEQTLLGAQR